MSRKQATFGQLVDYFEDGRQDEKYNIYHNIYSTNAENIKEEFNKNATFLSKRKNGVYMYHEVLSITITDNLSREQQKEILKGIGLEYIKNRANNNLVFAVLHDDKADNIHYHFMISSNELESTKRLRLSKEKFSQFKKDLELKVLKNHPELQQKKLISKEPGAEKETGEKLSNKGAELKRRTGKTSQKDDVKDRLKTVFSASKTKADFFNELEKENLSIYVNGNTIGILDKATQRKHRLKTLGMLDEFNAISQVIEESEAKKEDVKAPTNEFSKERIDTRAYHDQQKQYNESKPIDEKEQPKENKASYDAKAEPTPNSESRKKSEQVKKPYHHTDEKVKQEPSREANKERENKPAKDDYQAKTRRYSDRDSDRSESQDGYKKTDTKANSDRFKNSQEKRHDGYKKPKTDRYKAPKQDKTTFRPKEPKTEIELEIERRKAQLRKEREKDNEADYSKDFSKGK